MSGIDIVAVQPAYVGECTVGNFRVGVYTSKWEAMLCARGDYRAFTRRVPVETGTYAVSGWPIISYTNDTIAGVLQPKGCAAVFHQVGVYMVFDALFWTLDPMSHGYQITDLVDNLVYEVEGKPLEYTDPGVGGLAFRVCQAKLVEYP